MKLVKILVLALIAYAITTFVVWLLYDLTQQYMSLGMLLVAGAACTLLAAVGKLTERPVDFVVNTHAHGDHVGGMVLLIAGIVAMTC